MYTRNLIAGLFLTAGVLAIGGSDAHAQTATDTTVAPASYTVKAGDYLSKIAAEYETTYTRLFDANPAIADPDVINTGQTIRIPATDELIPVRVVAVATPAAPAPAQQKQTAVKRTRSAPAVASPSSAVATGDVWAKLAACESGGRANINTGNGYYGAYQFSASTWRGVGGSGLPSDASLAEQTARAQALQARSGWGQWPECSAKLGLR